MMQTSKPSQVIQTEVWRQLTCLGQHNDLILDWLISVNYDCFNIWNTELVFIELSMIYQRNRQTKALIKFVNELIHKFG